MIEVLLVLLTVAAFQVGEYLGLKALFIATAAVFWVTYVVVRWRRDPAVLKEWGFTTHNLLPATAASLAVLAIVSGAMFYVHLLSGPLWLPPTLWMTLGLYPLWGIVQQFLLNGIIARNLSRRLPPAAAVLGAAALFAVAHAPDGVLMVLTFIAACIWVPIYLRWRNLWPLGVCHGLLGAVAYYILLRRDVWLELTAAL
jgi:membrane protease YdiL (CAAX protease family)